MQERQEKLKMWLVASPVLLWGVFSGFYKPLLVTLPAEFWAFDIVGWVFIPIVCLSVLSRLLGLRMDELGLHSIKHAFLNEQMIGKAFIVTAIFLSFILVQEFFYRLFPPSADTFSYAMVIPKGNAGKLVILYLALTAAIVEEIFYRGLLYKLICDSDPSPLRQIIYCLSSALLFSINHWSSGAFKMLASLYLGLVVAWVFIKWKNLWLLIFGHVSLNCITG